VSRSPPPVLVPRHVAIIMDGNGRWAERRGLPRSAGHRAGVKPVRMCVQECTRKGVFALTLFAFSSENWRRPGQEVGLLMQLFLESLEREIDELAKNGVQLRFVGDRASLAPALQERMRGAEARTRDNAGLRLVVAIAYGGRWDILEAARRLARECRAGQLEPEAIDERRFAAELALAGLPDPDLFIRTGGTLRISNFVLWNLAYTELWFSDKLWPEFDAADFEAAFASFAARERRYGFAGASAGAGTC
jgi:undecaprenyl diphosphate synthase